MRLTLVSKLFVIGLYLTVQQPPLWSQPLLGPMTGIDASSSFLVYYGNDFSQQNLSKMAAFDVIVLDPNNLGMTPSVVAKLKKRDVPYVLGYISIGEDNTPFPIIGEGDGPVFHDGLEIVPEYAGIASFYVDQEWVGSQYFSDGVADINPSFGGRYIYPNAEWREVLKDQRIGGSADLPHRSLAGLDQIAGRRRSNGDRDRTRNFGFDGFFLDTLDTAGPFENVPGYYPWTVAEMSATVAFIRDNFPEHIILANRGLFFHNPFLYNATFDTRPYDYPIRSHINGLVFESYVLDSNPNQPEISPYFEDNRHYYAPKIMAEAARDDGFTVFSIDYRMDRSEDLFEFASIMTREANGWVEYLAPDGLLDQIGQLEDPPMPDVAPPVWDSTASQGSDDVPDRIGVQSLSLGTAPGSVVVQWDVARDQSLPIKYNIYRSSDPDFSQAEKYADVATEIGDGWDENPSESVANRFLVSGLNPGTHYFQVRAEDSSQENLEEQNQVTLSITIGGSLAWLSNPAANIQVDGALNDWAFHNGFPADPQDAQNENDFLDWANLKISHNGNLLYLAYETHGPVVLNWAYNLYLDTDLDSSSGFHGSIPGFPVGADYLFQGSHLFRYAGNGSSWDWEHAGSAPYAVQGNSAEFLLPRDWLETPASMHLFLEGINGALGGTTVDYYPDQAIADLGQGVYYGYRFDTLSNPVLAPNLDGLLDDWAQVRFFDTDPADSGGPENLLDWQHLGVAHNSSHLFLAYQNHGPIQLNWAYNLYLDTDTNRLSGFRGTANHFPIGAEFLIQGAHLFRYSGDGTSWGWIYLGPLSQGQDNVAIELSLPRSEIESPEKLHFFLLGDNTAYPGGSTLDLYPNQAFDQGAYFEYSFSGP